MIFENKFEGEKCTTPTLTADQLKDIFLRTANQVIDAKDGTEIGT